ncbi:hypothetical protein [Burkholderia ubonensis]|uniref:hypothetical protein n=1 Tax=Burkholderia ubonensis TaxID=101571 RepID=UPI000B275DA5|nr:hypothetical protein [Burkholderia ubonensis]
MSDANEHLIKKFAEAKDLLSNFERPENDAAKLISIKLRTDVFLYDEDYKDIYGYLSTIGTPLSEKQSVFHGPGQATVYRLSNEIFCLFIQHETGPDLIVYLHSARDVLEAATPTVIALGAFLKAVNEIAKIILKTLAKHNANPSSDRYKSGVHLRPSLRSENGEREIRTLTPQSSNQNAIQSIDEVIGNSIIGGPAIGHWQLVANGYVGDLWIQSVNGDTVKGEIQDDENTLRPLQGNGGVGSPSWDQGTGRLTFARTLNNGEIQTFDGYLFDQNIQLLADLIKNNLGPQAYPYPGPAMAGTFTGSKYEARPEFGWFALYMPH